MTYKRNAARVFNPYLTVSYTFPTLDGMKPTQPTMSRVKCGSVMVRIYTRTKAGGYVVHEVADYSTGARRLRSFSDRKEAVWEAERIARFIDKGEIAATQLRGSDAAACCRALELLKECRDPIELVASRYAVAVKLLGSDGSRIETAIKFYLAWKPENLPHRTVAEVVDELIVAKAQSKKSERYFQDLRSRLHRFAAAFEVGISSVTRPEVQRWLNGLKTAPQTVKNFRTVIGTLFAFAERRGYTVKGSNPVRDAVAIAVANGKAGM